MNNNSFLSFLLLAEITRDSDINDKVQYCEAKKLAVLRKKKGDSKFYLSSKGIIILY